MKGQDYVKIFGGVSLVVSLVLLIWSFSDIGYLSASMFWMSLFTFSICYAKKDSKKKREVYIPFGIGLVFLLGALFYMILRAM